MEIQHKLSDTDGVHEFWVYVSGTPSEKVLRTSIHIVFCAKSSVYKRIRKHAELRWDFQRGGWWLQDKSATHQQEIRMMGQSESLAQIIANIPYERYPVTKGMFVEIPKPYGDYPERKAESVLNRFLDMAREDLEKADKKVIEMSGEAHAASQYPSEGAGRLAKPEFKAHVQHEGCGYFLSRSLEKASSSSAVYRISAKLVDPASGDDVAQAPLFNFAFNHRIRLERSDAGLVIGSSRNILDEEEAYRLLEPRQFFRDAGLMGFYLLLQKLLGDISSEYASAFEKGHQRAVRKLLTAIGIELEAVKRSLSEGKQRIPRYIERTEENAHALDHIFKYNAERYDLDHYESIYPTAADRIYKLYKKIQRHMEWLKKNDMPLRDPPDSSVLLGKNYESHKELSYTLNSLRKRW